MNGRVGGESEGANSEPAQSGCTKSGLAKSAEKSSVKRVGYKLEEFLMERGIIKVIEGAGRVGMCLLMADPRPLRDGKGAWECWAASCKFFPMLRSQGHMSIAITHLCFDRLLLGAQSRLFLGPSTKATMRWLQMIRMVQICCLSSLIG